MVWLHVHLHHQGPSSLVPVISSRFVCHDPLRAALSLAMALHSARNRLFKYTLTLYRQTRCLTEYQQ